MTLKEWKADKHLCAWAQSITADPRFQLMLSVLKEESPVSYPDLRAGLPANDDSKVLGRIQGYQFALSNLAAMGLFVETQKAPEAVFEPEQINTQEPIET